MEKLNGLDLFSGIGGNTLALRDYIKTIAYCEFERHAQGVLLSRMRAGDIEPAPIWDDVTTLGKAQLGCPIDIVLGGFPCFVAGTLIQTKTGLRPIELLELGEEVLTHKGRWKPIIQKHITENRQTRMVKGLGIVPIETTDEHPFYTIVQNRKWDNDKRSYKRQYTEPTWTDAKNLQKDTMLSQVLPEEHEIEGDSDFWWIVGRYVADGWLVNRLDRGDGRTCRVVICENKLHANPLRERISRKFHCTTSEERTCTKFHICNKDFAEFLKPVGRGAENKEIPPDWLGMSTEQAKAFLDGYFTGDGSKQGNRFRATTVSAKLAIGISLLIQRAYGVCASIYFDERPRKCVIEGREVNQRDTYTIAYSIRSKSTKSIVSGNYGWKPFRETFETRRTATVYNIGVEGDESYVANGAIVHNCQDISVAGKGAGITPETRSGLFYQILRLVKELRPSFVFLENVPAIRTRGLNVVLYELTQAGYDLRWTMLSAASVGACHKRERWFLLAHHRQERGQGSGLEALQGLSRVSWSEDVRRSEDQAFRPNLFEPKLCRSLHDVPFTLERLGRLGNSVVPAQAKAAFEILAGIK